MSQSAFALLFVALPFVGTTSIGTPIALRIGPADVLEPASALSGWLAAGALTVAGLLAVAPLATATAALGSVFCAWICPYGLLSEALDRLRHGARRRWTGEPWRAVRALRFGALGALLAGSALLAVPLAAVLAPPRFLSAAPIEAWALRAAPVVSLSLLGAVLAVDLLVSRRIVCRGLCPVGGLAALLRAGAWRPRFEPTRCACPDAPTCLAACEWGLDPREMGRVDGCTSCLACVELCPTQALTIRAARGAVAGARHADGRRYPGAPAARAEGSGVSRAADDERDRR